MTTLRERLIALTVAAAFALGAMSAGCAHDSTTDVTTVDPSADEQKGYQEEAAAEINADNASSKADELLTEIEGDPE